MVYSAEYHKGWFIFLHVRYCTFYINNAIKMSLEKKPKLGGSIERQSAIKWKNKRGQLVDTLSEKGKEYTIDYKKMKDIIRNYYAKQWRDVTAKITYMMDNDDGIYHWSNVFISITEKSSILWVESSVKTNLSMDDLKKIISSALELEGKKLVDLQSNAITTSEIVGFGMGEHREKTLRWKTFTITIK